LITHYEAKFYDIGKIPHDHLDVPLSNEKFHKQALRSFMLDLASRYEKSAKIKGTPEMRERFLHKAAEYIRSHPDLGWTDYRTSYLYLAGKRKK
jgi:hypothetical protein